MTILVTGFEPVFAKYTVNPSWEAVKLLPDQIGSALIIKRELPCRYGSIEQAITDAVEQCNPDILLCVGHAGRVNGLEIEWLGVNRDDCSLADNDGIIRKNFPIHMDGADAYFTDLPVEEMVAAVRKAGVPAYASYTAGQFLCNHALYLGRYLSKTRYPGLKSGFIHVPLCPQQILECPSAGQTMEIETMAKGLTAAIGVLAEFEAAAS